MCKRASFIYRNNKKGLVEILVHDLDSHGNTQAFYPECTEEAGWYEGHYLPSGELECRIPSGQGRDIAAEKDIRKRYPTYADFEKEMIEMIGTFGSGSASGHGGPATCKSL